MTSYTKTQLIGDALELRPFRIKLSISNRFHTTDVKLYWMMDAESFLYAICISLLR